MQGADGDGAVLQEVDAPDTGSGSCEDNLHDVCVLHCDLQSHREQTTAVTSNSSALSPRHNR